MINIEKVMEQWAQYCDYDPDRRSFQLGSVSYELHRCCQNIEKIREYDPYGILSAIYAKKTFFDLIQAVKVPVSSILCDPHCLEDERRMYDTFVSQDFIDAEQSLLDSIENIVENVVGTKMIGERDREAEKEALFSSVTAIIEELSKCNVDLFKRGAKIGKINRFSTNIHIFERLADCLVTLERSEDGMYLCYIRCGDSADGYFGFFLKGNGTILSVNERIDEAYPGQHTNSRNGRWAESKKFNLFPYQFIFTFDKHDYLGYAGVHKIDNERTAFCNLDPAAYMPLIMAMVLLANRYEEADMDEMPLKYVDSLFAQNLGKVALDTNALTVFKESSIVEANAAYRVDLTTADVLGTAYSRSFDHKRAEKGTSYKETGSFPDDENIFVKMYGEGFELDAAHLLDMRYQALTDGSGEQVLSNEFIGTENRMNMIAYMEARRQLAEYIRDKMFEEYKKFDAAHVRQWWQESIVRRRDRIFKICAEIEQAGPEYKSDYGFAVGRDESPLGNMPMNSHHDCPFNEPVTKISASTGRRYETEKKKDPFNGAVCKTFFTFKFRDYKDLQRFIGDEWFPKILIGWEGNGRMEPGNSLLDATDPVWRVGTPFEEREIQRNHRLRAKSRFSPEKNTPDMLDESSYLNSYTFGFSVGFSPNGIKTLLKKYGG